MKSIFIALFLYVPFFLNAQVGIGTTSPHTSAVLELSSNNSGLLIPRMTESQRVNDINNPTAGLLVYQTDGVEGFYYFDGGTSAWIALNVDNDPANELELPQAPTPGDMAYWDGSKWAVIPATVNDEAVLQMIGGVPQWVGGTPPAPPTPDVGDYYGGGIVFYKPSPPEDLDGDGVVDTGLICSIENIGKVSWSVGSNFKTTNATFTGIGKGNTNTDRIITARGGVANNYAAGLARNYRGGGYSDWFLPSKDELNRMYAKRGQIKSVSQANGGTGFNTANSYWSSTEYSVGNNAAWHRPFSGAAGGWIGKNTSYYVRAIRTF